MEKAKRLSILKLLWLSCFRLIILYTVTRWHIFRITYVLRLIRVPCARCLLNSYFETRKVQDSQHSFLHTVLMKVVRYCGWWGGAQSWNNFRCAQSILYQHDMSNLIFFLENDCHLQFCSIWTRVKVKNGWERWLLDPPLLISFWRSHFQQTVRIEDEGSVLNLPTARCAFNLLVHVW